MENITQLHDGLWLTDIHFQHEPGIIGIYVLSGNGQVALVDVGPTTSLPTLLDNLASLGIRNEEVTHILLTHIHLDHAGAAGSITKHLPNAKVYVHGIGAPHLISPDKLLASATRIYGTQMETLWGEVLPVPEDRVVILQDGEEIAVAGRKLKALYTPGHASHHIAYYNASESSIFTGDVTGVHLQSVDYVRPPTPPPDLDLEKWNTSLDLIESLNPEVMFLPHFGPSHNPAEHIRELRERLQFWGEVVLSGMRQQKSEEAIIEMLKEATLPELSHLGADSHDVHLFELATNYPMSVQGYERYYQKNHPDLLAGKFI